MPSLAKRACSTPGCTSLTDAGFCPSCGPKQVLRPERGTAAERGYGWRWQKLAKAYLRTHPFAVDIFNCFEGRVYPAEVVDHIVPHKGDMALFWDVNNLQGLRKVDHDRKTALEDGGLGRPITSKA